MVCVYHSLNTLVNKKFYYVQKNFSSLSERGERAERSERSERSERKSSFAK